MTVRASNVAKQSELKKVLEDEVEKLSSENVFPIEEQIETEKVSSETSKHLDDCETA